MSGRILNTHFPGIPVQDGARAQICYALVDGGSGGYAVYCGIVKDCGGRDDLRWAAAEWVAQRGSKLRYRDALAQFPGLEEGRYRA